MLAVNGPNNIGWNPPFCFFASFLVVSLITFVNNPDSFGYLTILIISFISSFEIVTA